MRKPLSLLISFFSILFSLSAMAQSDWVLSYEVPIMQSFNYSFQLPTNRVDSEKMEWESICQKRFANEIVRPDQAKVAYRFNFDVVSGNEAVVNIRTTCDFAIVNFRH